ncbi:MAG: alpha/beta hydrolase [Firmicutes bacterium]|nr:alpha/beta hydrolase [Bacillota bacterium]
MTEKTFLSKDGKSNIHYYVWEPEGEPKAILQIVHGMAEHMERYAAFAEYLNGFGVLVCGEDHIGHGKSAAPKDWGYMGEDNGWKNMVHDVEQLHQIITVKYMDTPYFILGHSMGSFITRAWLAMYGTGVDGAIIMGTAGTNPVLGVAKFLVKFIRRFKGSRHISKLVTGAAFGSYNKHIAPQRTEYDWLTRDDAIVDKYIDDPACGFTFTIAGYGDLFNVIGYVSSDNWYALVPKALPMLIVSGAEDPVGAYGQGPAEVAERLQEAGCEDVSLLLYEDMRHEILNEYGKETVMEDIKRFIFGEEAPGAEDEEKEEAPEAEPVPAEEPAAEPEKVFYDTNKTDDRPVSEQALADAAEQAVERIDMTAEDAEAVAHKGIRNIQNEFEQAEAAVQQAAEEVSEVAEKAADKMDDYVQAFSDAVEDNVNEKVLEDVQSHSDAAKSVVEGVPDVGEVLHKGIRNIEQTLWEDK